MKKFLLSVFILFVVGMVTSWGQISISGLSGNTYTQDFNSLANTGTSNSWIDNTTIPGWYSTREVYLAGSGTNNAGGIYSFGDDSSNDRALGAVSSGSVSPVFGVRLINDTGLSINSIEVSFVGEQWRQTANEQFLNFAYQVGASDLSSGTWQDVPELIFTAPSTGTTGAIDGNTSAFQSELTHNIIETVLSGQEVWLRWSKSGTTSPGLAIDDLNIKLNFLSVPALTLSAASPLTESTLNNAELSLELTNETFESSISASNFELNNAPSGLTIASFTRNSDTQATLTLALGDTNFDEDITNFSVSALAAALTGNEPLTSNNLTITAHTKPDATTLGATASINGSATLNGQVSSKGYETTVTFEYGTDINYGTTVTASQSPLDADAEDFDVSYNLSGLTNGVEYHYRVVAVNDEGTTYGDNQTFTTSAPPSLFISEVSDPWDVANAKYVEVHNYGSEVVDLTANQVFIVRQANGSTLASVALEGQLAPGEVFVTTNTSRLFYSSFGFDAHLSSGTISGNGDDGYFLYFNGNHLTGGVMFDAFGVMDVKASSSSDWWYEDSKATRKSTVNAPTPVYDADEWIIVKSNVDRMLPGVFPKTVWNGSADNDWTNDTNWDNGVPTNAFSVLIWGGAPNFPELTATVDLDSFTLAYNAQLNGQEHLNLSGHISVMHQIEFSKSHENLNRWQYFTSPFSDLTAGGMLGANERVDLYMLAYDNSINENIHNAWAWLNDVSTPVTPGKGYALATVDDTTEEGDDIPVSYYHMRTTGTLVDANANTSVNLQYIGEEDNNWNMIGNPYLAPINWFDDTNLDFSNIQGNTAYVYNPVSGTYISIQSNGSGTGTVSPSGSEFIPPMQGFFVDAVSAGSFEISNAARVNNSQTFYKSGQIIPELRVQVEVDSMFDQTVIMFNEMANRAFDEFDANKLVSNSSTPQIYSMLESGQKLVFNHLNTLEESVALQVLAQYPGEYTLSLEEIGYAFAGFDIVLTDNSNSHSVVLSNENYTFMSQEEGEIFDFTLSFLAPSSLQHNNEIMTRVYTVQRNLIIQSDVNIDGEVAMFDVTGKKVMQKNVSGYSVEIETLLKSGVYLVQLRSKGSNTFYKVHVNNN